jgi:uncharacterized membrane protein
MNLFNLFSTTTVTNYNVPSSQGSNSYGEFIQGLSAAGVLLFFLGIAALIVAIVFLFRWWLVQTAIFKIQRDLSEINERQREKSPSNDDTES